MSSTSNIQSHVPPGFRFHPTDEELVEYYLKKKIECKRIDLDVIREIELYKIEPWDLQEVCKIGSTEQSEWYFFSHKDKKYPTGTRTNRATSAGFWKATGRDKAIYTNFKLIGMRKTLVFYKGRAPNGQKTDWIMHEYRLESCNNASTQLIDEGWVVCRVFRKRSLTYTKRNDMDNLQPFFYDDQLMMLPEFDSPKPHHFPTSIQSQTQLHTFGYNTTTQHHYHHHPHPSSCKQELQDYHFPIPFQNLMHHNHSTSLDPFQNLPYLEETPTKLCPTSSSSLIPNNNNINNDNCNNNNYSLIKNFLSLHGIANQKSKPLCMDIMNPLNEGSINHQYSGNNSHTSTNNKALVLDNDYNNTFQMGLDNGMTDWRVLDKLVASQLSNPDNNTTTSSCSSKEGCLIPPSASTNFFNLDKLDDAPIIEPIMDYSNADAGNIWNLGKREQDLVTAMHSQPDIFHSN